MSVAAPSRPVDQAAAAKSSRRLDERALRTLFADARTANGFLDAPVPREVLRELVELTELGPTAANSLPLRLVFVESPEAKARLRPALSEGNVQKTLSAPVTAIVAADLRFYEHLPRLFPHVDVSGSFRGEDKVAAAREFALMNATLQGGYFIVAARALGLDAGPMGGFDKAMVDAEFFPDGGAATIMLVNLGYGDDAKLFPRNPRLDVDQVARFV
ncbi:MAG TPA: malonic semialdehyde reductase [Candidatus Baltobacteraceae bacterium]|nr:malonic semialdehyde reductase [Candidatus Baltobacteraceae bacterium]